jgi:hypothetical protein
MMGEVNVLHDISDDVRSMGFVSHLPTDGLVVCFEEGDLTESPLRRAVDTDVSLKDLLVFCDFPAPYLDEKLSD